MFLEKRILFLVEVQQSRNMAEATTASFFKKRSPRTRSRLSYSSASEDDGGGKTPLAVPEGLRGLLNDVSREVGLI